MQMSAFCQMNPEVWLCVRWLKSSLGSPPQTPVMYCSEYNADFRIKGPEKETNMCRTWLFFCTKPDLHYTDLNKGALQIY